MGKYTTPAARIAELVKEHGSYRKAAAALGICHVYLYRASRGTRPVSANLLRRLGLAEETRYLRVVA